MSQLTFQLSDEHMDRAVKAIAASRGWTTESGMTNAQFAKKHLRGLIVSEVRNCEAQQAKSQATASVTDIEVT